jgi:hypothetical protein
MCAHVCTCTHVHPLLCLAPAWVRDMLVQGSAVISSDGDFALLPNHTLVLLHLVCVVPDLLA